MSMPLSAEVRIDCDVRIPLRDGLSLSATIYRPINSSDPTPCVAALTPYTKDGWHAFGTYFAAHGLAFVIADARGRGDSEGEFGPADHAASDGYDLIEWVARQPYCDGQVGMYGASDLGYVQWATAKESPPHLKTIVPTAAPFQGVDFPMRNNVSYPFLVQWLTLTSGRVLQARIAADKDFWSARYRYWHESGQAFRDLDTIVGQPSPQFQEWLAHPTPDNYFDAQNPTPSQYAALKVPILTITGSYDDDQPGALEHYRQHLRHASREAAARHFLIIGPWNHSGTQWPVEDVGGVKIGPAGVIDIRKLHLEWYRWVLAAGPRPALLEKRIAYYVMGAERWRHADSLEDATLRHASYFLDSVGRANDVFDSGSLGFAVGRDGYDTYTYDPRISGPEIEAETQVEAGSLVDQRVLFALKCRQLIYHSAPFESDTEITGFFRLFAWMAIDCPDTDFYVSVHEVDWNGQSIRLSTDVMRARYREGLRSPRLIATTEPLRYDFERFTFTSRVVKRGHCLRLIIAPLGRIIDGAFTQRNFNGGGVVSDEKIADARPVTVKLYHGPAHPSVLSVPLGHVE